jgi:alkylhydroperoxidase/carboxymuconolactone decarboxylase family protein YurZ
VGRRGRAARHPHPHPRAINDPRFAADIVDRADIEVRAFDPKTRALVRLAALIAVGGASPTYGAQADAALGAEATAAEIVDVLVGLVPVVGLLVPRVSHHSERVTTRDALPDIVDLAEDRGGGDDDETPDARPVVRCWRCAVTTRAARTSPPGRSSPSPS